MGTESWHKAIYLRLWVAVTAFLVCGLVFVGLNSLLLFKSDTTKPEAKISVQHSKLKTARPAAPIVRAEPAAVDSTSAYPNADSNAVLPTASRKSSKKFSNTQSVSVPPSAQSQVENSRPANVLPQSQAPLVFPAVDLARLRDFWDKQCAKCHGSDGKGQTKMGQKTGAKDFTDAKVRADFDAERMFRSIKEGIANGDKVKMKPVEGLTDSEIQALVQFVRSLSDSTK